MAHLQSLNWLLPFVLASIFTADVLAVTLPIVDLGYVRQQATAFNGAYYNFSNIRYAEPPTGSLRFARPVASSGSNISIDDGSIARICPQASPAWESIAVTFLPEYFLGLTNLFNFTIANATAFAHPPAAQPSGATEDCLFLDVMVPQKIFDGNTSAPVLVWIYGGGYVSGSKVSSGSPAGLIAASQATGSDGIIFVAMNYRLGALGWIAGSSVEASGTANAGLYDQRLALEWVQQNIHLFGGDPSQVTVMGESAGGASIMHQITAFGNSTATPFQRAIVQSPGFVPSTDPNSLENTAQEFLSILGVSSIAEAREKDSASVIQANTQQIYDGYYGTFKYGIALDGLLVPATAGQLLYENRFSKNVTLMVGHNSNEGALFADPDPIVAATYPDFIQNAYPSISLSVLAYMQDVLYPAIYTTGAPYGYNSSWQRLVQTVAEYAITCNTVFLESAFPNDTYAYEFGLGVGLHGEDVSYTFWNGQDTDGYGLPLNGLIARAFQEYITSFAMTGVPVASGYSAFPTYTSARAILKLQDLVITSGTDDVNKTRCAFWQQSLFNGQDISVNGLGINEGDASAIIMTASNGARTYTASVSGASSPAAPVGGVVPYVTTTSSSSAAGSSSASASNTTSSSSATTTSSVSASSTTSSTNEGGSSTSTTSSVATITSFTGTASTSHSRLVGSVVLLAVVFMILL